jgi:hypothetical protein
MKRPWREALRFYFARFIVWMEDEAKRRNAEAACVDINQKCPGCGHRSGKLLCVDGQSEAENPKRMKIIQHQCQVCGALWFEPCVVQPAAWSKV